MGVRKGSGFCNSHRSGCGIVPMTIIVITVIVTVCKAIRVF